MPETTTSVKSILDALTAEGLVLKQPRTNVAIVLDVLNGAREHGRVFAFGAGTDAATLKLFEGSDVPMYHDDTIAASKIRNGVKYRADKVGKSATFAGIARPDENGNDNVVGYLVTLA